MRTRINEIQRTMAKIIHEVRILRDKEQEIKEEIRLKDVAITLLKDELEEHRREMRRAAQRRIRG